MTKDKENSLIDTMYTEAERLKTYKNWPHPESSKCSAAKMAEAGFFNCPSEEEPDLAQCYVCYKKLHGWDADEDPWAEHLSHSKDCIFAKLQKPEKTILISELFDIEAERKISKIKMLTAERHESFKAMRSGLEDFYDDILDTLKKK